MVIYQLTETVSCSHPLLFTQPAQTLLELYCTYPSKQHSINLSWLVTGRLKTSFSTFYVGKYVYIAAAQWQRLVTRYIARVELATY